MASTVLGAVVFSFYMILSLLAPQKAICTGVLVLGVFEFVIGIAGSMSGCLICDCCAHSSGQVGNNETKLTFVALLSQNIFILYCFSSLV